MSQKLEIVGLVAIGISFKNSLIIQNEKSKENAQWVFLYLIKIQLNFTSIFLDQNNPKPKY